MNRSVVTGFVDLPCDFGWSRSVALYDHAEAVPVAPRGVPDALVSWVGADGGTWLTHCYCGPAALLPAKPPTHVPVALVEAHAAGGYGDWYVYAPWTFVGKCEREGVYLMVIMDDSGLTVQQMLSIVSVQHAHVDVFPLVHRDMLRAMEAAR